MRVFVILGTLLSIILTIIYIIRKLVFKIKRHFWKSNFRKAKTALKQTKEFNETYGNSDVIFDTNIFIDKKYSSLFTILSFENSDINLSFTIPAAVYDEINSFKKRNDFQFRTGQRHIENLQSSNRLNILNVSYFNNSKPYADPEIIKLIETNVDHKKIILVTNDRELRNRCGTKIKSNKNKLHIMDGLKFESLITRQFLNSSKIKKT